MLTKPGLKDEEIIACIHDAYELDVKTISFLPIGADFNTAVYRITTHNKEDYFLKLRNGEFLEAAVSVPKYLADLGIKQVIPPILTRTAQLWVNIGSFKAILSPYLDGSNGVESQLSEDQWIQFSAVIKKLHDTDIPSIITSCIPWETFSSKWREAVKAFLARTENEVFEESITVKTADFLKYKSTEILELIERTEELAHNLQTNPLEYVLCHADIHGWNLMVDKKGALYIIDWDTLIFAPKERDLMFIGAGIWDSGSLPAEEESIFYKGYGQTEINQDAICYYRFERIIQDIGEYCEHIFLSDEDGEDRIQSFEYLKSNFLPGSTIERAYQSDKIRKVLSGYIL